MEPDHFLAQFLDRDRLNSACDGWPCFPMGFTVSFHRWSLDVGTLRLEHSIHIWVELSGLLQLEWPFESIVELVDGFANLVRLSSSTIQNLHSTVLIAHVACHNHSFLPATFDAASGNFAFKVHVKIFDITSNKDGGAGRLGAGSSRVEARPLLPRSSRRPPLRLA